MDVFLSDSELSSISKWIKIVKKFKYKPNKKGYIRAKGKLRLPYPFLSSGYNRIVYDMGRNVLKIAISIKGLADNRTEGKLYQIAPRKLRRRLGKVLDFGDGWLIMKKIENEIPRTMGYKKKLIKLKKKFIKRGIMPNDILVANRPDPEWWNLGINKRGKIIILDYGNFKSNLKLNPSYSDWTSKHTRNSSERSFNITKNGESIAWINPNCVKI